MHGLAATPGIERRRVVGETDNAGTENLIHFFEFLRIIGIFKLVLLEFIEVSLVFVDPVDGLAEAFRVKIGSVGVE